MPMKEFKELLIRLFSTSIQKKKNPHFSRDLESVGENIRRKRGIMNTIKAGSNTAENKASSVIQRAEAKAGVKYSSVLELHEFCLI